MAYKGFWIGLFLIFPSLAGDLILRWTNKSMVSIVFKCTILFQGLCLWGYLSSVSSPYNSFKSLPGNDRLFPIPDQALNEANTDMHSADFFIHQNHDHSTHHSKSHQNTPNKKVHKVDHKNDLEFIDVHEKDKFAVTPIPESSLDLIHRTFGKIEPVDFPDLKYFSTEYIYKRLPRIFHELPNQFDEKFKSPCWIHSKTLRKEYGEEYKPRDNNMGIPYELDDGKVLTCLPRVYLLGQPKCGTSDLYVRLNKHPDIMAPSRKEIRWFTRGEFSHNALPASARITDKTSIFSFTDNFNKLIPRIISNPTVATTIDGGPHTLWWPTQSPD
eukprot:gene9193-19056_t